VLERLRRVPWQASIFFPSTLTYLGLNPSDTSPAGLQQRQEAGSLIAFWVAVRDHRQSLGSGCSSRDHPLDVNRSSFCSWVCSSWAP
jgi:hypothetical protein